MQNDLQKCRNATYVRNDLLRCYYGYTPVIVRYTSIFIDSVLKNLRDAHAVAEQMKRWNTT